MTKYLLLLPLLWLYPNSAVSQHHDAQKYKQIKSMEIGPWDFDPSWYYFFTHKNYSGADKHFQWQGIYSHFVIRFKEDRSNVKRVLPVREKSTAAQLLKKQNVEEEREYTQKIHDEEVKKAADRNIDLVYKSYKDDFQTLNYQLLDAYQYILDKSKYKLLDNVMTLGEEQTLINDRITYIHKTGLGYELENAKREKAYIAAKKDLQKLLVRAKRLGLHARLLYK